MPAPECLYRGVNGPWSNVSFTMVYGQRIRRDLLDFSGLTGFFIYFSKSCKS
jgi:hypothetical protein